MSESRGGRPLRKQRMEELERENKELRDALGMTKAEDIDDWGVTLTQEMRDALAARALVQEWGLPYNALLRLGFTFELTDNGHVKDRQRYKSIVQRVFDTDGVRANLSRTLLDIEQSKPQILARLNQTAQYGDDDASVRAASQLAKIAGWNKPDPDAKVPVINLYTLINGQAQVRTQTQETIEASPLDFLAHEPGDPVRVDSGDDNVIRALEGK